MVRNGSAWQMARKGEGGNKRRQRLLNYSDLPVTSSCVPAANH
jgi:hypothetical protein